MSEVKKSKFEQELAGLTINPKAEENKSVTREALAITAKQILNPTLKETMQVLMDNMDQDTGKTYLEAKAKLAILQNVQNSFSDTSNDPDEKWVDAFILTYELGNAIKTDGDEIAIKKATADYKKLPKEKKDLHKELYDSIIAYRNSVIEFNNNELVETRIAKGTELAADPVVTGAFDKLGLKIEEFVDMFIRHGSKKGSGRKGGGGTANDYKYTFKGKSYTCLATDSKDNTDVIFGDILKGNGIAAFETDKVIWDGNEKKVKANPKYIGTDNEGKPFTFSPSQWISHLRTNVKTLEGLQIEKL